MIRKFVLPLIALIGVAFAIYTVRASQKAPPSAEPVQSPPTADFGAQIAGAGIVESRGENIAVGTVVPGVVTDVFVHIGDTVKKGQKLFQIDARDLEGQIRVSEAAVAAAAARLARLREVPRPEDVPPLEAKVAEAEANLADRREVLGRLQGIQKNNASAVSNDELSRAQYAVAAAEAVLNGVRAELARLQAGSWLPDITIAEAELASARAELEATRVEWNRRTVVAPIDGTLLQVKVRPGEYATAGLLQTPLMLIGDTSTLHVRVDIDENDAWRLAPGAKAVGSLRGNSTLKTNLTFVRVEPYVVPKRSLTGESTERVDTRVLQVIYAIGQADFPIYVGQQMDVFIDGRKASE